MVRAHRLKQYAPPQGDTSPPPCRLKSSASRGCGSVRHARRQEGHGLVRLCRCTAAAWLCQRGPDAGAGAGAGAGACSSARNAQHGDGAGGDGCKTVMRDRLEARKLCFPTLVGRAEVWPGPYLVLRPWTQVWCSKHDRFVVACLSRSWINRASKPTTYPSPCHPSIYLGIEYEGVQTAI